jgi:trans-aconitate methyltransferase
VRLSPLILSLNTNLTPSVPPNCHFEVDDAEDPWLYSQKFDFIHGRTLVTCFISHLNVFRSAFEALQPGGWMEMQDVEFPIRCIDDTMRGTSLERWAEALAVSTQNLGKDFQKTSLYRKYFIECGFVDVQEKRLAWPIGSWASNPKMKLLGAWCK